MDVVVEDCNTCTRYQIMSHTILVAQRSSFRNLSLLSGPCLFVQSPSKCLPTRHHSETRILSKTDIQILSSILTSHHLWCNQVLGLLWATATFMVTLDQWKPLKPHTSPHLAANTHWVVQLLEEDGELLANLMVVVNVSQHSANQVLTELT